MGIWGPKLYQSDIAEEVRDYYRDQLRRGKSGKDITQDLIAQNKFTTLDSDDAPEFWFALADTQWDLGRLEDCVKERAVYYLNEGHDLLRWEKEDPANAIKRAKVLDELRQKLMSPQPVEKRVAPYKLYRCAWSIGDVYAYQLSSGFARENGVYGQYLYFIKVDDAVWHPGHIVPVVYFYRITSDTLLPLERLTNVDYLPQFFTPTVYREKPQKKKLYLLELLSTSDRTIPHKNLHFVGNFHQVKRVDKEDPNPYIISWKDFEKYIINDFRDWNDLSVLFN